MEKKKDAEKREVKFFDESLDIEARLDWLMEAMSMDEKLKCLSTRVPDVESLGIKGFSVGGEAAHGVEARNDQNDLGEAEPTTSFPQPIGMSATWDTELIRKAGEVTGREARILYHRHPDRGLSRWAPTVDLERDPRWGRTEEGYGEDPLLIGEMAGAYVKGMQGDHPKYLRVAATLKHFYANNVEVGRGVKSSSIDPRNRAELYLEPFRRVSEIGHAEAVMTAYNKINGIPGMLNPEVKEILKKQYGVKHVVCDGGAMELVVHLHKYFGIHAQTLAAALKAGVDGMSDNPKVVEEAAREAYELKLISEEEINEALRNMFRTKLRLGIYDGEGSNPYDAVTEADMNSDAHQEVCRQVSREAIVLLKNEKEMLPLSLPEDGASMALIGPLADEWYQDWYGGKAPYRKTLRQGLQEVSGKEIPCADGRDRIVFRCQGKGVRIGEDGVLFLSETEEPDVFIKDDWGSGSFTFRSVRTGKYMNARFPAENGEKGMKGQIAAEKEETFDWFVMEIFHLEEIGNGSVRITERFGEPLRVDADGRLIYCKEKAKAGNEEEGKEDGRRYGEAAEFCMEVVESGLENACKLAENRDVVILALGCNSMINAKEEVDRTTIALPPVQETLMEEIYKVNPNVVLVLFSNYPYAIVRAEEKLPAILWSATGGQDMGTAMAEALFGIYSPAGRLNMTWHRSDSQLPDIDDYDIIQGGRTYRYFEEEPLYPFGYGLTYTGFAYSGLDVKAVDGTKLQVSVTLKNTGGRESDEVVQIYGSAPKSRVKKPVRQLLGFRRIKNMQPGESRCVTMEIPMEEFRFYDVISRTMMVEEGDYRIYAGASCMDCRQETTVHIPGRKTGMRRMEVRTAADHYDECENIMLTEGQFGYASVSPWKKEKTGRLIYRDCDLRPERKSLILHMKSGAEGKAEVYVNGKKAAFYEGETGIYKDIRLELEGSDRLKEEPAAMEIRLTGDVNLCYFRME